ncbi:MAG: flagellar export protein FliJ [Defluviitaleaceae bacterium]|nr:flagellar export protein FliJ [Defluviitaleaceae bacterium]
MAKFVFRLQSYLGVKEKIEEQKKLEYGQALRRLEEECQKKIQLVAMQDELINLFKNSLHTEVNVVDIKRYNNTIEWLKYKIVEQEKRIAAAEVIAETKRLELIEAMKERKMLENVKEKKYEEFVQNENLNDKKRIDEIISYQYNR